MKGAVLAPPNPHAFLSSRTCTISTHTNPRTAPTVPCLPPLPCLPALCPASLPALPWPLLQLCMATVYSLLYGSLGRKITGEAKTA